ncbi:patatin-like phospholipase family protein [Pseudoalteromonas shioyasakiensis]|uniref:patatin-like phospholipase family protein n=1 Tax=Psychromonas sp. TaxID=1884585 RepID=UPI0015C172D6|nr:patatin-like phospholipase family protein [Pseudoalteromonas shioyasakiensis]
MEDKLGLVLSGGGAKGAYQVGILKYLSEVGIQPDEVSGTSIGALNAAVVSAQQDITASAKCLNKIWLELGENSPLQVDKGKMISTASVFLSLLPMAKVTPLFKAYQIAKGGVDFIKDLRALLSDEYKNSDKYKEHLENEEGNLYQSEPIIDLLDRFSPIERLQDGLPMYVGVYESEGAGKDIVDYFKANYLGFENKASEFWHLQSLPHKNIHEAIIASAALPLLFKAKAINGKKYRDGGIGGTFNQQGNTPIKPLVDSGCNHVIVSLLDDASSFNRHDYPDTTIIEVRPKEFISESMEDMLAFKRGHINKWIRQGYNDAKRCIGNSLNAINMKNHKLATSIQRDQSIAKLNSDNFEII